MVQVKNLKTFAKGLAISAGVLSATILSGAALAQDKPATDALYPEKGTFACRSNQNVNCGNPVRYTVSDTEKWETYFPKPPASR
jgi:hypothetical protein